MQPRSREELLAELKIAHQRLMASEIELEAELTRLRTRKSRWWPLFCLGFFGTGGLYAIALALVLLLRG